jgi:hypothetical protein
MHASRIVAHQDNPITLRTRLLSTPTPLKLSFGETGTTALLAAFFKLKIELCCSGVKLNSRHF